MKGGERGLVIIAVLWICALIIWLALQTSANIRLHNEEQVQQLRRSQAIYCAMSGVYEVLAHMGESLALEEPSEEDWRPDGLPRIIALDGCWVMAAVEEETTRVNINQAGPEALRRVLERAGFDLNESEALADRIADFLDPDDLPRLEGAEADSYAEQGLNYPPFNGPLLSLDQMVLIPGIDPDLFWGRGVQPRGVPDPDRRRYREWPAVFPARDSLFDLCTVYGNTTALAEDESELPFGETSKIVEDSTVATWSAGKIYRILAAGSLDRRETGALLWVVARYEPGSPKGFVILYRKLL